MTAPDTRPGPRPGQPRDADHWARYVETLQVTGQREGAGTRNVEGRRPVSPLQGFGKMWQKTFKVRLDGADVSPPEVVETWRERFPEISGSERAFGYPRGVWCRARSRCSAAASPA